MNKPKQKAFLLSYNISEDLKTHTAKMSIEYPTRNLDGETAAEYHEAVIETQDGCLNWRLRIESKCINLPFAFIKPVSIFAVMDQAGCILIGDCMEKVDIKNQSPQREDLPKAYIRSLSISDNNKCHIINASIENKTVYGGVCDAIMATDDGGFSWKFVSAQAGIDIGIFCGMNAKGPKSAREAFEQAGYTCVYELPEKPGKSMRQFLDGLKDDLCSKMGVPKNLVGKEPKFWVVWNPETCKVTFKHDTKESAEKEADRLAKLKPGQKFVVLESLSETLAKEPTAQRKEHVDMSDIPF